MEKTGEVTPGVTPDTECKLSDNVKEAGVRAQTEKLDDDVTKRLADKAASKLAGA